MIFGYIRVSTPTQDPERQRRNILREYPEAVIREDANTGTKMKGRKGFEWILSHVKSGDTIIFDSVSRMSRNYEEGIKTYFELYEKGVRLVFLNEHYIDTDAYADGLDKIGDTFKTEKGSTAQEILMASIMTAITDIQKAMLENNIRIAFEQAQKEVDDLHERTKQGIQSAKLRGAKVGALGHKSKTMVTKKSLDMKPKMKKFLKSFDGVMSDKEFMEAFGIARGTFYKYKREIEKEEKENM